MARNEAPARVSLSFQEENMADASKTTEIIETAESGEGGAGSIDWKAKFEEEREHSRKWEKRAKENKAAAEALDKSNAEKQEGADKLSQLQKSFDELSATLEAEKAENERMVKAQEVSQQTSVPVSLLAGVPTDKLQERAEAIAAFAKTQDTVGVNPADGKTKKAPAQTLDTINEISNPVERVKARAKYISENR